MLNLKLKNFDLFGIVPHLFFKAKKKYKSEFGGLMSLGLLIFFIVYSS
jgi:hypothetical protein